MLSDLLKGKAEVIDKVMKQVEPELREAILQLVEKLKTMQNVQRYSERLQSQKIKDKLQQKRHEKDRLKEELGSAYESSEESNYDDLDNKGQEDDSSNSQNIAPDNMENENLEGAEFVQQTSDSLAGNDQSKTKKRKSNEEQEPIEQQNSGGIQEQQDQEGMLSEMDRQNSSIKNKYYNKSNEIQEENEDKEHEEIEKLEPEFRIKHKHKVINSQNKFNPVRFLAKKLKEIIGKPIPEEESFLDNQDTQQFEANLLEQINSEEIAYEGQEQNGK